ncbi:MAG: efflux RND transporter periplasmic adaptor subunit [Gemmatimonadota bacterium]
MTTTPSPFDVGPGHRQGRFIKLVLFCLAFTAAIAAVLVFTRKPRDQATESGHQHQAGSALDSTRVVMLSAADARRIGVTFAVATMGTLEREVRTVAQVTYDETSVASIATRVDGWVERLYVNAIGQPVRRGDPLFSLYSPMIMSAEQDLLLARELEKRVANGTPDAQVGAASLSSSARRRLELWDVPETEIERLLRTGTVNRSVILRSQVSGVVIEKPVLLGQRVMAGDPLYRIADLSSIWVEGQVFERDLPSIRIGQRVSVEMQALPGRAYAGSISYISPTLNPDTRTATARVVLTNASLQFKPGMYATIQFTTSGATGLSIPRSAVLVTGERALAFLKRRDGSFEPRQLTLGRTTDERVEVLSGLTAGDSVVASATFLVDAESNLGTIMGGMGDMPGMDIRQSSDSSDSHPLRPPDTAAARMPPGMNMDSGANKPGPSPAPPRRRE